MTVQTPFAVTGESGRKSSTTIRTVRQIRPSKDKARQFLLFAPAWDPRLTFVEKTVMRFDQQIRASIARSTGAAAPAPVSPLPAARQAVAPQLPPAIAAGAPLSMEDAVKMALENNLGIQAE